MSEPTAHALSRHFSNLINRNVSFVQAKSFLENKVRQVYGVYEVFPGNKALVVKADLSLLGSFAGAMVGLPDAEVKSRLMENPLEELLRDAMNEVFNVASAVIASEGRAVFRSMATSPLYLGPEAEQALNSPLHRSYFDVEIEGYAGGKFFILS